MDFRHHGFDQQPVSADRCAVNFDSELDAADIRTVCVKSGSVVIEIRPS